MASVVVVCPVALPDTTVTAAFDRPGGGPICVVNTRGRTALTTPLTIAPDPRLSVRQILAFRSAPIPATALRRCCRNQRGRAASPTRRPTVRSATTVSATQHRCAPFATGQRGRIAKMRGWALDRDPGCILDASDAHPRITVLAPQPGGRSPESPRCKAWIRQRHGVETSSAG